MTIEFRNNSELPLECITTFGISVKENESPIGYFGTGLKYAIAVLLRENCQVQIFIGSEEYKFKTIGEYVRGKMFNMIYMNDMQLPFTTELGKNWELWQAYRELWSNCKDEGGSVHMLTYDNEPYGSDKYVGTRIFVDGIDELHKSNHEFILNTAPLVKFGSVEMHPSHDGKSAIFYKGIKVNDIGTHYSYNITNYLTLTEDRTASEYSIEYEIVSSLCRSNDVEALQYFFAVDDHSKEASINFNEYVTPSSSFMQFVAKMRKRPANVSGYYDRHYPAFIGKMEKGILSNAVIKKLQSLRNMFKFKPGDIFVTALDNEDFKIVPEGICLDQGVLKNAKRMQFAYILACHKKLAKNAGKNDYTIIVENMLSYMSFQPAVKS